MTGSRLNPFCWLAWAVVAIAFLMPVGALFVRSFRVYDVVMQDGTVHRAVGEVRRGDGIVRFELQGAPDAEKISWEEDAENVREVRSLLSLDHYERVFTEPRTLGLLENSALIALGGALLALLLGLPIAFVLARTELPGRYLLAALCMGPAILPPFFIALGGARRMQAVLISVFGVSGGSLQVFNSIVVFGFVLFPLTVLLVGPALARVPAGPWESARLLGGRRAALRHVLLPALLPSVIGTFVLCFLMALTDFAVPDVLGFMLPAGGSPTHVFATEILFQWKQTGNTGRAVATGAPFLVVTVLLLALAGALLRRSPVFAPGRPGRLRPRVCLSPLRRSAAYVFVLAVLGIALFMPLIEIAGWAGPGGESASGGTTAPQADSAGEGTLFDFGGTLDRTVGARDDRDRWLLCAFLAALLAMGVAVPLARQATRGGRLVRTAVLVVGALPLAVPGLVFSVGTLLFWQALPWDWVVEVEDGVTRSVLVLSARFLPFALLGSWLALRAVRRGHEEAAAALGAGPLARARRIVAPLALPGVLAGGLLVLVLALRELDAIVLVDPRVLPMRLYDKIHFNRMADEANLLFLCLGLLLIPALLLALLLAWRARRSAPTA
jgi:iron(III) transport system permease protein